jgi:O-antigen/teichoic acid export membrane protein
MKKQILSYSISSALNRASQFLFLPLATQTLSLAEFGAYSLVLVLSQLSFPFFALNGQEVITREGASDTSKGRALLNRFFLINLALWLLISSSLYLLHNWLPVWIVFGLVLGGLESMHQLIYAYFRISDRYISYFIITLLKALLVGGSFVVFLNHKAALGPLLLTQTIIYALLALAILPINQFIHWPQIAVRSLLPYALFLLPAGISQWVMNSSDRFIIQHIFDESAVGKYSIAYSLGLLLMVLNSGLALSLPQEIFKNYPLWRHPKRQGQFSVKIVGLNLIIFTGLFVAIKWDINHLKLIQGLSDELIPVFVWVCLGMVTLSFYYIPANIILYHKKSHYLTQITLLAALTNLLLTYFWTLNSGILGAAKATAVSYAVFSGLTALVARRLENESGVTLPILALWAGSSAYILIFLIAF